MLGLEITYDKQKDILRISQEKYLESLLNRCKIENCMGAQRQKRKMREGCYDKNRTEKPFRELVGCLMHLSLGTRLDICFAVTFWSRFQDKTSDNAFCHLKGSATLFEQQLEYWL